MTPISSIPTVESSPVAPISIVTSHSKTFEILPIALQDDEISEADFELLVKIAEDKNASSGRLRFRTADVPAIKIIGD